MSSIPARPRRSAGALRPGRAAAALGGLTAAGLLLAACGGSSGATSTGSGATSAAAAVTTLRVINTGLGDTYVDPATDEFELYVGNAEALLHPKPGGQDPWLADSVEPVDAAQTTWKVTLHPGITFQSGKPLNAAALVKWFEYEVKLGTDAGDTFKGATAKADGDLSMVVTFPAPHAQFRGDAANYTLEVYDSEMAASVGKDYNKLAGMGIFTGPYMLTAVTAQKWSYAANPTYWRGTPALKTIEVQKASDAQAAVKAIQAGEADILWFAPVKLQPVVAATKGLHFNAGDSAEVESLAMNLKKAPWNDVAVRKALALTVDSEAISKKATFGVFPPTKGWFPTGSPLNVEFMAPDLAQANQVLDAAGWVKGADGVRAKGGVRLEADLLSYSEDLNSLSIPLAEAAKEAGFKLTPKLLEYGAWNDISSSDQKFGVTMINYENFGINGDLGVICRYFSTLEQSFSRNEDPALKDECLKISKTRDTSVVEPAVKKILEINAQQYYVLPITQRVNMWVTDDTWKSAKPDAFYMPTTWDMQAG